MNEETAVAILEALAKMDDPEVAHSGADSVLCDLLQHLGYSGVVEAWRRVRKWYA